MRLLLLLALFASGTAGLIDQVVWQRALKVYLGGSETISSMIVVLVFLAGLGVGSLWMGRRIDRIARPARWLAGIELALAACGCAIATALGLDASESIYQLQRLATGLGLPLRIVHAAGAFGLLSLPCFLMGATLPVASEICQRSPALRRSGAVGQLYAMNTAGAVLGCLLGAALLLPLWGQRAALLTAASLNLAAALSALLAARSLASSTAPESDDARERRSPSPALGGERSPRFALLAFGFGFCALWYEMFLYRAIALRHQPLPLVFSGVLAGFLLFWSLGSFASSLRIARTRLFSLRGLAIAAALSVLLVAGYGALDRTPLPLLTAGSLLRFLLVKSVYFWPAFGFGLLFGSTIERAIRSWGRDVGWFAAWNTAGSCGGILLATLLGYEVDLTWMLLVLALLLLACASVSAALEQAGARPAPAALFALLAGSVLAAGWLIGPLPQAGRSARFFGRDGVIEIDEAGFLYWDGLEHSRLSRDGDHVGSANWALAADPVLAHPSGAIRKALVIGLGGGITAATLAKHEPIQTVDVYDINRTLERVLERFPDGTLHAGVNPKLNITWLDGRTGLAINPKKYDLITQQPLHLKQAGASLLLSKEYFRLVSSRLEQDGVFAVFSNGTPEQAMLVRQTASQVFPHMLALHKGYELLLSRAPLDFSRERIEALSRREGQLFREVRELAQTAGEQRWLEYLESPPLPLGDPALAIRDDLPIVEYPFHLRRLLQASGFSDSLPPPSYDWQRP